MQEQNIAVQFSHWLQLVICLYRCPCSCRRCNCQLFINNAFFVESINVHLCVGQKVLDWGQRQACICVGRKLFEVRSIADLAIGINAYRNILRTSLSIGVVQVNDLWVYSNGDPFIGLWASGRPAWSIYLSKTIVTYNWFWDDPDSHSTRAYICEWTIHARCTAL